MKSKRTRTHLEYLARKYGIELSQAEEIAEAPFRFLFKVMAAGDKENLKFDSVRIIKWGLFSVKEGRKEFFKKLKNVNKRTDYKQRTRSRL